MPTYVPFKKYLDKEVKKACELAHAFETKLIRGFSFYHPKGTDPRKHLPQVVEAFEIGRLLTAHRKGRVGGARPRGGAHRTSPVPPARPDASPAVQTAEAGLAVALLAG